MYKRIIEKYEKAERTVFPELVEDVVNAFDADRDALLSAIPCRRFGRPEDLAKVLVFLSSDIAEYMNGTEVYISGGKFCTQNPQYGWEHMV